MQTPAAPLHSTADACAGSAQSLVVQQVLLGMQALAPQSLASLSHAHEQEPPGPLHDGMVFAIGTQSAVVQQAAAAMHVPPHGLPPTCLQMPVPSQASVVHGLPSSLQGVPAGSRSGTPHVGCPGCVHSVAVPTTQGTTQVT